MDIIHNIDAVLDGLPVQERKKFVVLTQRRYASKHKPRTKIHMIQRGNGELVETTCMAPRARRLTRKAKVCPAQIFGPDDKFLSPEEHFPLQHTARAMPMQLRHVNKFSSREMMIVVDGSCIGNGQ